MRSSNWPAVPVTELQAAKRWALNGGPFGSKLVSRDYVDSGVPVIRGANLPNSKRFSFDDFVFVSEQKADELLANNAHPGDVVFTQRGTLGQVGIIPRNSPHPRFVISQSQMKMTVDESRVDPYWLFYCFRDPSTQQAMINRASTSGVPHINLGVLREFQLRLPPLPYQRQVASILSAYDDLIENNTRRIAILEEMARRIYEEWFVRFRFPGHENVRMVESGLGLVPEGWRVISLGEVLSVEKGLSYKGEGLTGSGVPMVNLKNILPGGGFRRDATKPYSGQYKDRHVVRVGDIVIANTDLTQAGTVVGSPALVPSLNEQKAIFSHHIYAVRLASQVAPFRLFVYRLLAHDSFKGFAKGHAVGTTVLGLPKEGVTNYKCAWPTDEVMHEFCEQVLPIHKLFEVLHRKIDNLRTTRDLLLPKLISGELDVSALPVAEAVAA